MSITTYEAFLAALSAVDVDGIVHAFDGPPASVETADLPAKYATAAIGTVLDEGFLTMQTHGGWPKFSGRLVVLVEEVGQGTVPQNHALAVQLIDNIARALRSAAVGVLAKASVSWTIDLGADESLSDRAYWAVVANVESAG